MVGWHFAYGANGKTPADYLFKRNPTGKLVQGMNSPVGGWKIHDLSKGINVKDHTIPPLLTWKDGHYLNDIERELELEFIQQDKWVDQFIDVDVLMISDIPKTVRDLEQHYRIWVVTGEGCPGAWLFLVYILPPEISTAMVPKHPAMWSPDLKEYKGDGQKFPSYKHAYTPPPPSKPKAPEPPPLPVGLRSRCPGCGHYYKLDDLAAHTKWACPGNADNDGSMAIMCDALCGCPDLHVASKCKEGFPLPKPVTSNAAPEAEPEKEDGA